MEDNIKTQMVRLTAYKVPIILINNGKYIKEEGDFTPNYIELEDKKISRVNIIGVVVSAEENEKGIGSIIVDDGTGRIPTRGFEQQTIPKDVSVGDIINIIGRPREFGTEKYIVPEILKKTNEKWMRLRKFEIEKENFLLPEKKESVEEEVKTEEAKETNIESNEIEKLTNHEKIIRYIKENDRGKGVETEEILRDNDIMNCEKILEDMLKEGDLFETLPGRVKVLE